MGNNLGGRIKLARKNTGLTQGVLAAKLGIAYPTLNKYERGHRVPDSSLLHEMVKILKCDPGWLLTGEDNSINTSLSRTVKIPVMNKVSETIAGQVSEEPEEYIGLPGIPEDAFAFIVKGDNMLPAVRDGDYAIFVQHEEICSGDIVVVNNMWNESMIRRYHKKEDTVFLVNDNPEYPKPEPDNLYTIVGKVIAVWRQIRI